MKLKNIESVIGLSKANDGFYTFYPMKPISYYDIIKIENKEKYLEDVHDISFHAKENCVKKSYKSHLHTPHQMGNLQKNKKGSSRQVTFYTALTLPTKYSTAWVRVIFIWICNRVRSAAIRFSIALCCQS